MGVVAKAPRSAKTRQGFGGCGARRGARGIGEGCAAEVLRKCRLSAGGRAGSALSGRATTEGLRRDVPRRPRQRTLRRHQREPGHGRARPRHPGELRKRYGHKHLSIHLVARTSGRVAIGDCGYYAYVECEGATAVPQQPRSQPSPTTSRGPTAAQPSQLSPGPGRSRRSEPGRRWLTRVHASKRQRSRFDAPGLGAHEEDERAAHRGRR